MNLIDLEQHVAHIILKRHGGDTRAAALEMGISTRLMESLTSSIGNPSDDPMDDAGILVDILREFFPQISPTDRVSLFASILDGYCQTCGSDFGCQCESGGWPVCNITKTGDQ